MAASIHCIVVNLHPASLLLGGACVLRLRLWRALSVKPYLNLFALLNMTGLVRSILGMGNPLLDVSAVIDEKFLEKYGVGESCCFQWMLDPRHHFTLRVCCAARQKQPDPC